MTRVKIATYYGGVIASNVYIIKNLQDTSKSIIIDTSRGNDVSRILNKIKELGLQNNDIYLIILTHTHYDHCSNTYYLKQVLPNAKVLVHTSEARFLKRGDFKMPFGRWIITNMASPLTSFLKWMGYFRYMPVEPDIIMKGGKRYLDGYSSDCYIIHTPGHSDGSISVIINKIAFVGDLMYARFNGTFGYKPPYGKNSECVCLYWKKLIDLGCKVFYPGHGDVLRKEDILLEIFESGIMQRDIIKKKYFDI